MDTKTLLLNSAERVARARGFDGFSYADLAQDVGIRKASIHHHFPTKADLALALVRRYRANFRAALADLEVKKSTPLSALTAYVNLYRDALSDGERLCLCVAFSVGVDRFDKAVLGELQGFHSDSEAWLVNILKAGQADGSINKKLKPAKEAVSILALMEGAQLLARVVGDVKRFDQAAQLLSDRLRP